MISSRIKASFVYPALLVVGVLFLFYSSIHNGFSGLDDLLMIQENWDHLTDLNHIYTAFTEDVFNGAQGSYYRPIQILSYMPDAFIANSDTPTAQIFFIINILMFAVAMVQLYFFLGLFDFSAEFRFVFSLFFLIHPALTPAVAWIPGRVDILLFLIVISSIWCFILWIRTSNSIWGILHVFFFALGMFTKETSIVIPVISILIALYFSDKTPNQNPWKWEQFLSFSIWKALILEVFQWIKTHYPILIGWLLSLTLWQVMRKNALPDDPLGIMSALFQISTSWKELIILFGTVFVPFNLQVFLEITWPYILMAVPGFILFFALPKMLNTSFKNVFLGFLWMFLFIFPTTLSDFLNYHRLFIPLVGMAFLLRPFDRQWSFKDQKLQVAFLVGLAGLFLYENLQFQKAFVDKQAFWTNAVYHSPNSAFANNGMAWSYHLNQETDSALKYYQRVVDIRPDRENVRMGMALIHEERKEYALADSLMQAEFIATKDSSSVYFYIGQVQLERQDTSAAISNLTKGYGFTKSSRNARIYYDTLNPQLKQMILSKTKME
ncbi:tetratricopeptide repeat protein [bacterium SCSIO 12643]|nr:tetratricopeptide repeat protein [bacterium SCSIO 12643]